MASSFGERSAALDTMRGLAIVGMVLVNDPGSPRGWHQLVHAPWNGCRLADVVFPAFLFVVGASMALTRELPSGWRVVRRAVLLVAIGVALNWAVPLGPGPLRYPGVLQRIGFAYLAAAVVLRLPLGGQVFVGAALLGGYGWALLHVHVPGIGTGVLTPAGNLAGWVDRSAFGQAHLYRHLPYDPEGLASTSGAVVTVLLGSWAARWLRARGSRGPGGLLVAAAAAAVLLVAGRVVASEVPLNKRLWTPSYVLWTGGLLVAALAVLWELVERRRWRWLRHPWAVLGYNALLLYVATEVGDHLLWVTHVGRIPAHVWLYAHWFAGIGSTAVSSAAYSLVFVALVGAAVVVLYRRGISLRV